MQIPLQVKSPTLSVKFLDRHDASPSAISGKTQKQSLTSQLRVSQLATKHIKYIYRYFPGKRLTVPRFGFFHDSQIRVKSVDELTKIRILYF